MVIYSLLNIWGTIRIYIIKSDFQALNFNRYTYLILFIIGWLVSGS